MDDVDFDIVWSMPKLAFDTAPNSSVIDHEITVDLF